MLVTMLAAALLILQDPVGDLPAADAPTASIADRAPIDIAALLALRPGDIVTGTISESDPIVITEVLRSPSYANADVRAKTYRLELPAGSMFTIELRSYLFDAYLVLRDASGTVLAEDDDGLLTTHARLVIEPRTGAAQNGDATYLLNVCALHGGTRDFEIRVLQGEPKMLSAQEQRAAQRTDKENRVEAIEAAFGSEHAHTASALNDLAILLYGQGDFVGAESLLERALRIRETALGPDDPETAESLSNLATLLNLRGDLAAARPLMERAVRICETALGPDHLYTAASSSSLAALLTSQGDHTAARPLLERALRIRETALGPEDPQTAASLGELATLLQYQGDLAAARPMYERALHIYEAAFGGEHSSVAGISSQLASLLQEQGDLAAARPLMERAVRIYETTLGPDHPWTARSVASLAGILQALGDYAAARPLYDRTLRINENVFGPEHPNTAATLSSLTTLLIEQGDYAAAQPHCERALRIYETVLGPEHLYTSRSVTNLATVLYRQLEYAAARPLYERSIRIKESEFGPEHPDSTVVLYSLAMLLFDLGEAADALSVSKRALQNSRATRLRLAWSLTESERLLLAETQRHVFLTLLSVAKQGSSDVRSAAYETVLQWKAQVLRSLSQSRGQSLAGVSDEDQTRVDRLSRIQTRLSQELFRRDVEDREAHQTLLADLRKERQRLERELNRSLGKSKQEESASVEALARALPADSVLIDFLVHPTYVPARRDGDTVLEGGRWTASHLSAWVLHAGDNEEPRWLDLGEAAPIEQATKAFLESLVTSRGIAIIDDEEGPSPTVRANKALRSLLWDPIREQIGDAKRVFVSPDSFLGSLPFEVLRQEDDRYLIERFGFVYLQDAASIANRPSAAPEIDAPGATSLLCVGGVDYRKRGDLAWRGNDANKASDASDASDANDTNDANDTSLVAEGLASATGAAPDTATAHSSQRASHAGLRAGFMKRWSPLPATRNEAIGIADLHEEAFEDSGRVVLQKRDATEERIKYELPRHRVLHLATHGFFQPEGLPSMWEQAQERGGGTVMVMREEEKRLTGLLPGLLSGLVFSGANKAAPTADRDDGLLTAEEISFLDLSNVDLVVLSACESGLGRPQGGEGMLGFRRTFRAAGARTVISSLWKVSDEATNELMQSFYERLWLDEESTPQALRNAQLDMLKRNRIENDGDALPSTWGAFVLDGAWE